MRAFVLAALSAYAVGLAIDAPNAIHHDSPIKERSEKSLMLRSPPASVIELAGTNQYAK